MAEIPEIGDDSTRQAVGLSRSTRATGAPGPSERPVWLERSVGILSPLWVAGLGVAVIGISLLPAALFVSRGSRLGVWIPYLALGTVFPALVILVLARTRSGNLLPHSVARVLIVIALASPIVIARPAHVLPAVGLAAVQTAVSLALLRSHHVPFSVALMAVGTASWLMMLKLFAWDPMPIMYPVSWPLLVIGAVSLAGACWWAFCSQSGRNRFRIPLDALAIGLLVLLAFRTDGLFQTDRVAPTGSFYHWGATVGPAEAVRQGGVLLWDVPAPYGFLLPLTIALFPAATSWQSLYVLNALATSSLAVGLYLVVRWRVYGVTGAALSVMLSAATVSLAAMYPPLLLPEHYYPMGGAFRFGWCYVLIGILLLERVAVSSQRVRVRALVAGTICWVLATLWSPESAFFGTLIWVPAYVVIVLREHSPPSQRKRVVSSWLLFPAALFVFSVSCIFAIYQIRLGHVPDLQSYFEVVLSFGGSRVAQTSDLFGPTDFADTALVLVFGVIVFAIAVTALVSSKTWRDAPLALGLMCGMWALLAYPVSQPFLFASYRLLPFLVLGMAIVLALSGRAAVSPHTNWTNLFRAMTVPVLATILVTAYANVPELAYYARAIKAEPFRGRDVTSGLPQVDASLQSLMNAADVQPTDALFYEGTIYGETLPVWKPAGKSPVVVSRQWLAGPLSSMIYLADARKQTYLARAADRQQTGGWLIQPRHRDDLQFSLGPWFFEQVNRTHMATKFASNDDWQLIWFEPRIDGGGNESVTQDIEWSPDLAEDIRVNGENLASVILPMVWGVWGPEWTPAVAGQRGRCVVGTGTFRIFSPVPTRVTVKLLRPESSLKPLTVRVNDTSQGRQRANQDAVALSLQSGWNTIAIALADQGTAETSGPESAESCVSGMVPVNVLRIERIDIRTR